jgi:hypothetical protein
VPARALAALAALLLGATACGGDSGNPDADHEQALRSGMGLVGTVHCSGSECRVTTLQPIATEDEAWFIALPVVSAVDSDPKLETVRTLDLNMMNRSGTREARFDCTFPADRTKPSSGDTATVELVHDRCRGTFSGF